MTVSPGGGLETFAILPSTVCRSIWQPTPQKLQVERVVTAWSGSGRGDFFLIRAPVGQVSMQPPHSSQVVSR